MNESNRDRGGTGSGSKGPRVGNYVLEGRIGGGGMAEVYLATAVEGPLEGRKVAIKRLRPQAAADPDIVDRFLGEADLARLIAHPGIVEIFDVGSLNGSHFLVMEYVDGKDLRQVITMCAKRSIALPIAVCTHMAAKVLEAAGAIHGAVGADGSPLQVTHCDLSPANIFLSRDGEVKIGDLGVAHVGSMDRGREGFAVGKLGFLSPEQVRGEGVDRRADLFAVGVILFELLTGSPPFPAHDLRSLEAAFSAGPKDPCSIRPQMPSELAAVMKVALAIDPTHRYYDAEAFLRALGPFRDSDVGGRLALAAVVRVLFA